MSLLTNCICHSINIMKIRRLRLQISCNLRNFRSLFTRTIFFICCVHQEKVKNSQQAAETRQNFAKEWVEYPLVIWA